MLSRRYMLKAVILLWCSCCKNCVFMERIVFFEMFPTASCFLCYDRKFPNISIFYVKNVILIPLLYFSYVK